MDPIHIAEFVLELAAGVFVVLFSAAFGVTIAPIKMSHNADDQCSDVSYIVPSIFASMLVCFASTSLLCASCIKMVYERPSDGKEEANSLMAWRLVYALVPLASITFILAYVFFVIVLQLRLGKIGCWSYLEQVFICGPCMVAIIAGLLFVVICYRCRRDAGPILDGGLEGGNVDDGAFFTPSQSFAATRSVKRIGARSTWECNFNRCDSSDALKKLLSDKAKRVTADTTGIVPPMPMRAAPGIRISEQTDVPPVKVAESFAAGGKGKDPIGASEAELKSRADVAGELRRREESEKAKSDAAAKESAVEAAVRAREEQEQKIKAEAENAAKAAAEDVVMEDPPAHVPSDIPKPAKPVGKDAGEKKDSASETVKDPATKTSARKIAKEADAADESDSESTANTRKKEKAARKDDDQATGDQATGESALK